LYDENKKNTLNLNHLFCSRIICPFSSKTYRVIVMMYALLLFFVLIELAVSCKCMTGSKLSEDFAKTPKIFIGRVINKVLPPTTFGTIEYTMEVEEAFKVI